LLDELVMRFAPVIVLVACANSEDPSIHISLAMTSSGNVNSTAIHGCWSRTYGSCIQGGPLRVGTPTTGIDVPFVVGGIRPDDDSTPGTYELVTTQIPDEPSTLIQFYFGTTIGAALVPAKFDLLAPQDGATVLAQPFVVQWTPDPTTVTMIRADATCPDGTTGTTRTESITRDVGMATVDLAGFVGCTIDLVVGHEVSYSAIPEQEGPEMFLESVHQRHVTLTVAPSPSRSLDRGTSRLQIRE
jgi:hypothetical protein